MGKVIAFTNLTLDGVMQGPAEPDEDRRDGFAHGGWAGPYAAMQHAGGGMASDAALLFGRRTYQDFHRVWPGRKGNPFSAMLDNMTKYVASTTLKEPLPWVNSTLLHANAGDAISILKRETPQDFLIFGSGVLVQSLMRRRLVDEFLLLIHPLVLGNGRRLFADGGAPVTLRLIESTTTPNGVVIARYQPA